MSVSINLRAREFQENPYPVYAALRREEPVHRASGFGRPTWLLTRHADIVDVLRDPRFSAEDVPLDGEWRLPISDDAPLLARLLSQILLMKDGEEHARLRALLDADFRPQAIARRRMRVVEVVEELLAPLERRGEFDLMSEFAGLLPVIVIAEILGLPTADAALLRRWSLDMSPILDPTLRSSEVARVGAAAAALCNYLQAIFLSKRTRPSDDLVSRLSATPEAELGATPVEQLAAVFFLLVAGNETIASGIGNSVVALLEHRDQLELLLSEPTSLPQAVEELLRFDCPVQGTARRPRHDVAIGGREIRRGEDVFLLLGAANRDPERFPDPDRLDLMRQDAARHLAFSAGPHYCLGAALGRLETRAALEGLLHRFSEIEAVPGHVRRRRGFVFRGFDELRLRVAARKPRRSARKHVPTSRRTDDVEPRRLEGRSRAHPRLE